jgi:hypothetical protein
MISGIYTATEKNSPICLEEGLIPVANSFITLQNINSYCLEEVNMTNDGRFKKGDAPWIKGRKHTVEAKLKQSLSHKGKGLGRKHTEETKRKISEAQKGCTYRKGSIPSEATKKKIADSLRGRQRPKEVVLKVSQSLKGRYAGELSPYWKGGQKLRDARMNAKRKQKGFILITYKNPYDEPIEYHHPNPKLPYVIPCPKRIHQMFGGKHHIQNVNAFLGIKINTNEYEEDKDLTKAFR